MKYYKLLLDGDNIDPIILQICEDTLEFDRYDVENGNKFQIWNKEKIKIIFDKEIGFNLTDYVVSDLDWFIVTEKLKNLLLSFNLGDTEFLPLTAIAKDGTITLNIYLVNICNIVDAINLENSKYNIFEINGDEKMFSIIKYAIISSEANGYDMFRLKNHTNGIFVSEKLKNGIITQGITGCDFLEIKVV